MTSEGKFHDITPASTPSSRSGGEIPRAAEEWAALAKVASGRRDISREQMRSLFMLGLVERRAGIVCLTQHGRLTLGLSE